MWPRCRTALLVAGAVILGAAAPRGDIASGKAIVAHGTDAGVVPCLACHGDHLQGNASIGAPVLAHRPRNAILVALVAIADGKLGNNVVMRQDAKLLTPRQRLAVATYLAQLEKVKPALAAVVPGRGFLSTKEIVDLSIGAEIVQHGASTGVPACQSCHGRNLLGQGGPSGAPALAGWPAAKTVATLRSLAAGGSAGPMPQIARRLTASQREAVAAFIDRVVPAPAVAQASQDAPPHPQN